MAEVIAQGYSVTGTFWMAICRQSLPPSCLTNRRGGPDGSLKRRQASLLIREVKKGKAPAQLTSTSDDESRDFFNSAGAQGQS